jgi:hypothetical protein
MTTVHQPWLQAVAGIYGAIALADRPAVDSGC